MEYEVNRDLAFYNKIGNLKLGFKEASINIPGFDSVLLKYIEESLNSSIGSAINITCANYNGIQFTLKDYNNDDTILYNAINIGLTNFFNSTEVANLIQNVRYSNPNVYKMYFEIMHDIRLVSTIYKVDRFENTVIITF